MEKDSRVSSFEQSIQLFDSLLRVRWGDAVGRWVIDRKGYVPASEVNYLKRRQSRFQRWLAADAARDDAKKIQELIREIAEEIHSAKEGRRVILYTGELDRRIFDMLVQSDIKRFGGYSRMADEIDRLEQLAQKKREKAADNQLSDLNREVFDQMDFIERRRWTDMQEGKSWREMLKSGTKPREARENAPLKVIDRRVVAPEAGEIATL